MKRIRLFILLVFVGVLAYGATLASKKEKTRFVVIETKFGDIKIKLYNQTPLHRDNFIKLVDDGFYDSLLFHRVIKDFMIQGGDPGSKHANKNKQLGDGGPGYTIDAEIVDGLFHKKGAIAAARKGDHVNPNKESSGSQFYIVQGTVLTKNQLVAFEDKRNAKVKQKFLLNYITKEENKAIKSKLDSLNRARAIEELNAAIQTLMVKLEPEIEKLELFRFSEEQIQAYTTIGGAPHLDYEYTVFGEVIEGLNIIDKIAKVKTRKGDRPVEDIIIKMKVVKK